MLCWFNRSLPNGTALVPKESHPGEYRRSPGRRGLTTLRELQLWERDRLKMRIGRANQIGLKSRTWSLEATDYRGSAGVKDRLGPPRRVQVG